MTQELSIVQLFSSISFPNPTETTPFSNPFIECFAIVENITLRFAASIKGRANSTVVVNGLFVGEKSQQLSSSKNPVRQEHVRTFHSRPSSNFVFSAK